MTVDAIVEAAARVFRREGWDATTNRIAEEAGVGIGSLYEYFPDKRALLVELAERHVALAEREIGLVLGEDRTAEGLVAGLQTAIVASHRFPSLAVELVRDEATVGEALKRRVTALQAATIEALVAAATEHGATDAYVRGIAAFELLGPATTRALYLHPDHAQAFAAHYRGLATRLLTKLDEPTPK